MFSTDEHRVLISGNAIRFFLAILNLSLYALSTTVSNTYSGIVVRFVMLSLVDILLSTHYTLCTTL